MRGIRQTLSVVPVFALTCAFGAAGCGAQTPAPATGGAPAAAAAGETSRAVAGGGISVAGWTGRIDANEAAAGLKLENAKLSMEGANTMRVTTGPAVAYWNPANRATGNYTVSATFTEPQYMNVNSHPHPYGIFVAGNNMGTDQQSYLYCAAYGNGNFIMRGFAPAGFQLNGGRGQAHAAVNRAAGPNQPVTQAIAINVNADNVECSINGTVVGTYPKSDIVQAGRLTTTDGIYGVRFGHNTDATVSNLRMTRR